MKQILYFSILLMFGCGQIDSSNSSMVELSNQKTPFEPLKKAVMTQQMDKWKCDATYHPLNEAANIFAHQSSLDSFLKDNSNNLFFTVEFEPILSAWKLKPNQTVQDQVLEVFKNDNSVNKLSDRFTLVCNGSEFIPFMVYRDPVDVSKKFRYFLGFDLDSSSVENPILQIKHLPDTLSSFNLNF